MAEFFVGPIMDKIITCFEYLQDNLSSQTSLKELEERLREICSKIQAVAFFASQAHIRDQQGTPLNKWMWQLQDAIDEADDLLDEFVYMEHKKRLAKNKETTKVSSPLKFLEESFSEVCEVSKGFLKTDSNLKKRLEEVVQKLDKILTEVSTFLCLLKDAKQMQQVQDHELLKAREEESLPDCILSGQSTVVTVETVEHQQLEVEQKCLEKRVKLLSGLALSLSIPVIIAGIDNISKSGRNRRKLLLDKATISFSLLSILAASGLLYSLGEINKVGWNMQQWLIFAAIIFAITALVVFTMNALI